jgi:hypothetical protein
MKAGAWPAHEALPACRQRCASSCGRRCSAVTRHIGRPAMPRLQESSKCLLAAPIRGGLQAHVAVAVAPLAQQHTGADARVAAADESRHTGVADLPLLLLAVAEVVPDDGGCATVGQSGAGRTAGGCRRKARAVAAGGFLMDAVPGI